ncbi:protein insensitive-like [Bactrocera neohumeralis]|uniref:protein insensitive-like n=1 Tax=Bactrocera neohumeralis TaxID=98809 RepID=UPI002164F58D|nr:protein insensitive-like [Bactrocera neohumeralis]
MDTATSTNNTVLETENIELTEIALDLTLAFVNEPPPLVPIERDLPTKRQRDSQTEFNLMAKKSKPNENITVQEEAQPSVVKPPMIRIPQYPLRDSALGEHNSIDEIMRSMALQPIFEDFVAVLHGKKIDELGTLNTSNLQESVRTAPHTALVQKALNKVKERNKENQLSNIANVNEVFSTNGGLSDFELGPNGTRLPIEDLRKIKWKGISSATRSLLDLMFDRETLATHTLSGNSFGSLQDRICPLKGQLDPLKVKDLIYFLKQKFDCSEGRIRIIISQKCAAMNHLSSKLF